MIFNIIDSYFL